MNAKPRPIITHEMALKFAGPAVGIKPVKALVQYLDGGINYQTVVLTTSYAMHCPRCNELCSDLYRHPAGRGPCCPQCLRACEVVEVAEQ